MDYDLVQKAGSKTETYCYVKKPRPIVFFIFQYHLDFYIYESHFRKCKIVHITQVSAVADGPFVFIQLCNVKVFWLPSHATI